MEIYIENLVTYSLVFILLAIVFFFYMRAVQKETASNQEKILRAKELGFHEPVSLHPVVNLEMCIGSGACILACPEKDILGLVNGHAAVINASRCVGHGACFHACPMNAISLHIGTEKRGVELPHVNEQFETNIPGLYIAGELGGMGLIRNAVEQGKQAIDNIAKKINSAFKAGFNVIIVGAGPAGISATLEAVKLKLKFITLEQDSLGGTVFNFPRGKIVMTSPMELPLHGKIKLSETSKSYLISLWNQVLCKYNIRINEQEKVINIERKADYFEVLTDKASYTSDFVLLAIGRRGSPRKLGVPGEGLEKVAYRLIEPELIINKKILIVGGGDSAIEAALALINENNIVTVSYRGDSFSRLKAKNLASISAYQEEKKIHVLFNSSVKEIGNDKVIISLNDKGQEHILENDLVYIFAGGELPAQFLDKIGVRITKKFGEAILK